MKITDITNGIAKALHEAFGADYKKYIDEVPQGFKTPAFLILFLSLEHTQRLNSRWRITPLFNVQYFPNEKTECPDMALKVQRVLREITLVNGVKMRASSPNSEIIDGVGHNFMQFNFDLFETEAKEFMGSLTQQPRTGGTT